ncbi:MAG TPA: hypothetical protein ENI87_15100 [bacterium]|nr:hypothetical protein [bacterium]
MWRWYAVGSTRDANVLTDLLTQSNQVSGPQAALGGGVDLPTAQGAERCTTVLSGNIAATSLPFEEFGLGDPGGGGIAVEASGRAVVVGTTASADFPVVDGRAAQGSREDAVRILLDLVPEGVARTDGTGVPAPFTPTYPVPGVPGGTTPDCALSAFGRQIGRPAPELARMHIDWIGPAPGPGSTQAEVIVVRPPDTAVVQGGIWGLQLDWPGFTGDLGPSPVVLPEGYVVWTNSNAYFFAAGVLNFQSLRFDLLPGGPLPASPLTTAVQLMCLVNPAVTGGVAPNCSNAGGNNVPLSSWVASPCLWFTY